MDKRSWRNIPLVRSLKTCAMADTKKSLSSCERYSQEYLPGRLLKTFCHRRVSVLPSRNQFKTRIDATALRRGGSRSWLQKISEGFACAWRLTLIAEALALITKSIKR